MNSAVRRTSAPQRGAKKIRRQGRVVLVQNDLREAIPLPARPVAVLPIGNGGR